MKIDENPYKTTTKHRIYAKDQKIFGAGHKPDSFGNPVVNTYDLRPVVFQETTSEGHPFYKALKGKAKGIVDFGGPFSTTKIEGSYNRGIHSSQFVLFGKLMDFVGHPLSGADRGPYSFMMFDTPANIRTYNSYQDTQYSTLASKIKEYTHNGSSDNDLLAMGTTAIARTRPNESGFSSSQALAELLKDGIPFRDLVTKKRWEEIYSIIRKRGAAAHSIKELADVFLEGEFGLAPLVSDIESMVRLVENSDKLTSKLHRDSLFGGTRTRYTFDSSTSSSSVNYGHLPNNFFQGDDPRWLTNSTGVTKMTTTTVKKQWFSGAWAIFMPDASPAENNLHQLSERLKTDWGVDWDIETIWNLAPWSWLVDWEFNMGDVIRNFSHFSDDSVLLRYGYIMESAKTTRSFARETAMVNDLNPTEAPFAFDVISTRKHRLRATPYGFGKTFGGLSNLQKAILAAIGVTRF